MTRKETTEFLSNLLVNSNFLGRYWAKEVTFDWGKSIIKHKRVDYVQYKPENQLCVAGLEQGEFTCYEIKSCKADFNSGNGLNFEGDKNYIVLTMKTYKELLHDEIQKLPHYVGIMIPIPCGKSKVEEFENPTELSVNTQCDLLIIKPAFYTYRKRSTTEMLFCMLRSWR